MARRRRGMMNPSKAQWAVLGVGGLAGLGLLGYGIYLAVKPASAAESGEGSLGLPGAVYEYRIIALTSTQRAARAALGQPARAFDVNVTLGGGQARYFNTMTRKEASSRARKWIAKQGGTAVCMHGCPQDIPIGVALPPP
jgi:hypothetical protein